MARSGALRSVDAEQARVDYSAAASSDECCRATIRNLIAGGSVAASAASGTRLELAKALRDRVARSIDDDDTPAAALAALTKRLTDVMAEIDVLEAAEAAEKSKGGPVGDGAFNPSAL